MNTLDNMMWRYATKKMDATKKVASEDIKKIKEVIRLAASSYGLQPYKVLEVSDGNVREQLKPLCWNQTQITDASHLFIFCNQERVSDSDIDRFVELKAESAGVKIEQFAGYGDFVKVKLKEKSDSDMFHWTAKQAYIALAGALNACAELRIDSTPIEGFEPEKVNALLGLTEKGLNACVILAVGYRAEDDANQHVTKVRKPAEEVFEQV